MIQIWDSTGLRIYRSHQHTDLPQRAELGFSNVTVDGNRWRVYSTQLGDTVVQIAQPLEARSEVAAQMAMKTVAPLLLLLPFLGLIIWVDRRPRAGAAAAPGPRCGARDADSLRPISEAGLPQEIRPLTTALNDLLAAARAFDEGAARLRRRRRA